MLRSFSVVLRCEFVMFRRLDVKLGCLLGHLFPPEAAVNATELNPQRRLGGMWAECGRNAG
jgi:hypothetical protein